MTAGNIVALADYREPNAETQSEAIKALHRCQDRLRFLHAAMSLLRSHTAAEALALIEAMAASTRCGVPPIVA